MKRIIPFCIAAFLCCNAFSQNYDNNWVFGDSTGLNFSTDPPAYINSGITGYEANASISDAEGNLLFYTNGQNVWNREHEIMPNGDSLGIGKLSLLSDNDGYSSSISQGVIILPKPGSNEYYVFYIQAQSIPDDIYGLEFAVVNIDLNSSLGDVTSKNIKIYDGELSEKMQAVRHANGRDWWLLVRNMKVEDTVTQYFIRFLISPTGIDGTFFQNYGPESLYSPGEMTFSQNGSKLAFIDNDSLDFYDFDRCTGELSNVHRIKVAYIYGCAFSPDGSKIYLSEGCGKDLFQYSIEAGSLIESSKQIIYHGPNGSYCQGQLGLGPNGKIYLATPYNSVFNNEYGINNQNLSVINFPNETFPACDFDTNTVSLGDRRNLGGLPNMPNYNLGALTGSGCDTLTAINTPALIKNAITLYPNPAKETITITSHLANYTSTSLQIFAVTGEKLKEEKITVPSQKINIAALPQGMYTVVVKDENGYLYSDKLVITQ